MLHNCLWGYSTYAPVNPAQLQKGVLLTANNQKIWEWLISIFELSHHEHISLSITPQSLRNSLAVSQIWGSQLLYLPAPTCINISFSQPAWHSCSCWISWLLSYFCTSTKVFFSFHKKLEDSKAGAKGVVYNHFQSQCNYWCKNAIVP